MDHTFIANKLENNIHTFKGLLLGIDRTNYLWRPKPEKWNLLEIVCHLLDEEREDFKARVKHVLETPTVEMPGIDPAGWVIQRNYKEQDYDQTLNSFFSERENSVKWLRLLVDPQWNNVYKHPKMGDLTARMFLVNWLAHDHLHIRQIVRMQYEYLKHNSNESLAYAGNW